MKTRVFSVALGVALLSLAVAVPQAHSAIFDLDFNTNPEDLGILFTGDAFWEESEGIDDSGYLVVTNALNGERGAIIFPDLEEGNDLFAFNITAELRVGGGTDNPADGFSFNFARPEDPVFEEPIGEGYAASPTGEENLPEEGTQTGLGIGFDEWYSGGEDVIGMSIRIDDELIDQIEFPTQNGDVDDPTSLQTGPAGVGFDFEELGWATLELSLSKDNNLRIAYKGEEVFNDTIDYEPSPGLLVFAGRTGGSNANHHIDNISIRTNADASGGGGNPIRGDFNGDGVLDAADIDDLTQQSASGANLPEYDLNGDSLVDAADVDEWISADDIFKSWLGDANLDGEFNTGDLVSVLASGTYETGAASVWSTGDFNGDGLSTTGDLVAALSGGGYENGPRAAVAAIPEPASITLLLLGSLMFIRRRR